MAFQAEIRKVYDGGQTATLQIIGKSDGSGQETNVVKVDVSELNPPCATVKIEELSYDVEGGFITLLWDDLTPIDFAHLRGQDRLSYRREGGLQNLGDPASRSGDLLLSTTDMDANATYTVLLKLRKKFA
jgi:hypothetical protein